MRNFFCSILSIIGFSEFLRIIIRNRINNKGTQWFHMSRALMCIKRTIFFGDYFAIRSVSKEFNEIGDEVSEISLLKVAGETLYKYNGVFFVEIHPVKLRHISRPQISVTYYYNQFKYHLGPLKNFGTGFKQMKIPLINVRYWIESNLLIFFYPNESK